MSQLISPSSDMRSFDTAAVDTPPSSRWSVNEFFPPEAPAEISVTRRLPAVPGALLRVNAAYALDTYALSPAALESCPPIESAQSLGDPYHYRMFWARAFASGISEFCGLADGFFVSVSDVTYAVPLALTVSTPDMLRIRIAMDSDGEYLPAPGEVLDIKGPSAVLIIEPPGMPPSDCISVGHHVVAHIHVHRTALQRLYPQSEQLPAIIQAFLKDELNRTIAKQLPLGPDLLRCVEELQRCSLTGRNRWLYIQSKTVEILCHAFEALGRDEAVSGEPSALITRAVLRAQQLLTDQFAAPPSLDDLAREVGLSRTGLCAGFHQLVGQSVFDYVIDLRMQHALELLNQNDVSITEIAYAVGYNYPSSFSVAVQRRFGATPRELRRRRLSAS